MIRFDFDNADFEQYPAAGLYAPGGYTCICTRCEKSFCGHKRAMNCYQCAIGLSPQADRNPEGQDPEEGLGAQHESGGPAQQDAPEKLA